MHCIHCRSIRAEDSKVIPMVVALTELEKLSVANLAFFPEMAQYILFGRCAAGQLA